MRAAASFRIFETAQFDKDLHNIARAGHPDVVDKLRRTVYPQLRRHPHFGPHVRKLRGVTPDTWRYRIGAWRFFYEIDYDEGMVFMIGALHRGSAYPQGAEKPSGVFQHPAEGRQRGRRARAPAAPLA